MISIDDIRARYPHLGIALYAYTPGGPVTLEFHGDGKVIGRFEGATEAAAIAAAFPPEDEPEAPAVAPTPPTPTTSVFD